jgi:hypothetical protein
MYVANIMPIARELQLQLMREADKAREAEQVARAENEHLLQSVREASARALSDHHPRRESGELAATRA